jgi:hypothetical protein
MVEAFLAAILLQPSEYRSGFQMVTILTTTYSSADQFVRYLNGQVIRCAVPAKIDHSNTGLVLFSNTFKGLYHIMFPHLEQDLDFYFKKLYFLFVYSFVWKRRNLKISTPKREQGPMLSFFNLCNFIAQAIYKVSVESAAISNFLSTIN